MAYSAAKILVINTSIFRGDYPRAHLYLKDGSVLVSHVTEAQGDPENKVSDDVIWGKYIQLTSPVIGSDRSDTLITQIRNMAGKASTEDLFNLLSEAVKIRPRI